MNLSLQPFVEAAYEIGAEATYAEQNAVKVAKSIVLKDLIDQVDIDNNGPAYYYYKGSLTTPECNEVVNWIVMENTISISEYQVRHSNSLQASYQKSGEGIFKLSIFKNCNQYKMSLQLLEYKQLFHHTSLLLIIKTFTFFID